MEAFKQYVREYRAERLAQGITPWMDFGIHIEIIAKGLLWLACLPLIILFYCAKICLGAVD